MMLLNILFITKLHELKETTGLHLRHKLGKELMLYFKKKMNVRLTAQLLNESVAKSIQYLKNKKVHGF